MKAFKPHKKTCRNTECRSKFHVATQSDARKTWCSTDCALAIVAQKRVKAKVEKEKRERRETSQAKAKLRDESLSHQILLTQDVFNAWIRERDHGLGCISCRTKAAVQYCAGHYRTVGSNPALRFEPLNVHLQCNRNCNLGKSGNIVEYRIGLVERIGPDAVAWLEGPHEPKRYTIPELKELRQRLSRETREMVKAREGASHGSA